MWPSRVFKRVCGAVLLAFSDGISHQIACVRNQLMDKRSHFSQGGTIMFIILHVDDHVHHTYGAITLLPSALDIFSSWL